MNIQAGSSYIHNPASNPPVVAQPARSMGPQEVGFMRGYVFSFVGLLRFGLIVKTNQFFAFLNLLFVWLILEHIN